jgi:hypothetical protein
LLKKLLRVISCDKRRTERRGSWRRAKRNTLKPMVIGCQEGIITPIVVAGREEIRAMIDLFGEDADWIVVIMTAWMRRGITPEYLQTYEVGQISAEPEREEVLMIQIALRDGSNKTTVKRIIRDDEIRFEEVHLPRGVSFDGYLSL